MDLQENQIHVVKTLKKLRLRSGISQVELAQLLHRPQSYVSKYETGARQLNILEIRQICLVIRSSLKEYVDLLETSLNEDGINDT